MSGTSPGTYINALVNIIILPSENILLRNMILTTKAPIDHLFKVLKKCRSKFHCLVYEMLFVKDI